MHAMGRYRTAFNTTPGPVAIDDDGATLGGHEWGPVRARTDVVEAAVERGDLTYPLPADEATVEREGGEGDTRWTLNEQVVAALDRTAELNELAANPPQPSELSDDELRGMPAIRLVDHLREYPGDAARVDTIEAGRDRRRSTVDDAIADARKLTEEV